MEKCTGINSSTLEEMVVRAYTGCVHITETSVTSVTRPRRERPYMIGMVGCGCVPLVLYELVYIPGGEDGYIEGIACVPEPV